MIIVGMFAIDVDVVDDDVDVVDLDVDVNIDGVVVDESVDGELGLSYTVTESMESSCIKIVTDASETTDGEKTLLGNNTDFLSRPSALIRNEYSVCCYGISILLFYYWLF